MNNPVKILSLFLISLFAFSSCDKVENPIQAGGSEPVADSVIRKILIEDFTGHTCGNCPEAAITAQNLQNIYDKKIIIVGVHSGYFAKPLNNSAGSFKTDFRTPAGDEYNTFWKVDLAGNPNGFVSRSTILNDNIIVAPTAWGTAVEALKDLLPDVKLDIRFSYDTDSRALNTTVKSLALNELKGKYKLVLYLVEDNIIDWQRDYSLPASQKDNPNFLHRHVLRGTINNSNSNNAWGDEIISSSLAKGDSTVATYSNFLLDPKWNADECSIVAYIYDAATYEIIQVEEAYLKK